MKEDILLTITDVTCCYLLLRSPAASAEPGLKQLTKQMALCKHSARLNFPARCALEKMGNKDSGFSHACEIFFPSFFQLIHIARSAVKQGISLRGRLCADRIQACNRRLAAGQPTGGRATGDSDHTGATPRPCPKQSAATICCNNLLPMKLSTTSLIIFRQIANLAPLLPLHDGASIKLVQALQHTGHSCKCNATICRDE